MLGLMLPPGLRRSERALYILSVTVVKSAEDSAYRKGWSDCPLRLPLTRRVASNWSDHSSYTQRQSCMQHGGLRVLREDEIKVWVVVNGTERKHQVWGSSLFLAELSR